jgi:hypothetical protein
MPTEARAASVEGREQSNVPSGSISRPLQTPPITFVFIQNGRYHACDIIWCTIGGRAGTVEHAHDHI